MQTTDYTEIGNRIRAARKRLNLTQEQASERCDITASYYGNLERGDKIMSVETLIKISKGLNISADYILFGESTEEGNELLEVTSILKRCTDPAQYKKYIQVIQAISTIIDKL